MKIRISLSVNPATAEILENMSNESYPHASKSAIGEAAIIEYSKINKEAQIDSQEKTSCKEKTSSKKIRG